MPPTNPTLNLKNQYGELSENTVVSGAGQEYAGEGSFQVIGPDLNLNEDAGSDDVDDPSFLATIMGNIFGDTLTKAANYIAGVIGAFSVVGAKDSDYPTGGVMGIISDGVSDVDGAVVAVLDGDSEQTNALAAFKARMLNSTGGSGFDYGLDLSDPGFDAYPELAILKAAIRMNKNVCIFNGATAPVDGTTGDNFAGRGSLYVALDTGLLYQNTGIITAPVWSLLEAGDSVLSQPLTGFVSGAGTVAASDTVLQGVNKLSGNLQNRAVTANLLTGLAAGSDSTILAADTILVALAKLQAQIDAIP